MKKHLGYFEAIAFRVAQLDQLGNDYLAKFDFLSVEEMARQIWEKAQKIYLDNGEDWDKLPDWVATTIDNCVPYSMPPTPGSLYKSLSFSLASNDAHLRNLFERAKGRETKELDFPVFAENEVVDKLAGITPIKKSSRR